MSCRRRSTCSSSGRYWNIRIVHGRSSGKSAISLSTTSSVDGVGRFWSHPLPAQWDILNQFCGIIRSCIGSHQSIHSWVHLGKRLAPFMGKSGYLFYYEHPTCNVRIEKEASNSILSNTYYCTYTWPCKQLPPFESLLLGPIPPWL